jgi:FkbM family methyltransferase
MDQSYFRPPGQAVEARAVRNAVASLAPGATFVDVGANSGFFALIASKRCGPNGLVIAVEPSAREFERLLAAVRLNDIRNIVCVKAALSERDGVCSLEVASSHTGLNRLAYERSAAASGHTELIVAHRGDSLMRQLAHGRLVQLVKIDVEGAELDVIRGLEEWIRTARPAQVVVEITPEWISARGGSSAELYSRMERIGYCGTTKFKAWQYDETFLRLASAEAS